MSRKIKVLHIQLTENFGGIESLLTNVYANIDRSKYQFDFIVTAKEPYQKRLTDLGGNVFLLPSIRKISSYARAFNKLLNNDYDIVHFHKNSAANIIPVLIVKNHPTHPKIIIHSHNTFPSIQNIILVKLHRINRIFLSRIADEKIACSNAAANWMFGKNDDVQIINNGIDIKKFTFSNIDRKAIRKKYSIKDDDFVVGAVGRFTKQKNYKMTIEIFNEIKKLRKNSKLMIIGDGYLKKAIIKQVYQLGLENDVLFLGLQLNVSPYLSAMDAFLMPSIYEGLGIAAVEAQSEGLPTYISNKFPKEVTLTNLVRRFSLKQSPYSIANTIVDNIRKNIRNELTAKEIKKSNYSLNNTVRSFANIYQGILNDEKN